MGWGVMRREKEASEWSTTVTSLSEDTMAEVHDLYSSIRSGETGDATTPTAYIPAADAAWHPTTLSSNTTHSEPGRDWASRFAPRRKMSGAGFPSPISASSPQTTTVNWSKNPVLVEDLAATEPDL